MAKVIIVLCATFILWTCYWLYADATKVNTEAKNSASVELTYAEKEWLAMANLLQKAATFQMNREIVDTLSKQSEKMGPKCREHFLQLFDGILKWKLWAVKFLDSSGRPMAGTLQGHLGDLGDYDTCLSLKSPDEAFYGKYCLLKIRPELPKKGDPLRNNKTIDLSGTPLDDTVWSLIARYAERFDYDSPTLAICFPSTCSTDEVEIVLKAVAKLFHGHVQIEKPCETLESINQKFDKFTLIQKISLVIVLFPIALVVISLLMPDTPSLVSKMLQSYNPVKNTQKLLTTSSDEENQRISYIHGTRTITIMLSIVVHINLVAANWGKILYAVLILNSADGFLMKQYTANNAVALELMFLIGGLLTIHTWHPILVGGRKVQLWLFALVRWMRFLPTMVAVIALTNLMPFIGSGPMYNNVMANITKACETNLLPTLFYYNNINLDINDICLFHTWYLSSDFQLYLISFPVIMLLFKTPKKGVMLACLLIVLGMIVPGLVVYVYRLPATINFLHDDPNSVARNAAILHFPFYNHLSAYFLGVLMGHVMIHKLTLSDGNIFWKLGWILGPMMTSASIYMPSYFPTLVSGENRIYESLYAAFHRIMYVSSYAWAGFAMQNNKADKVKAFFSWSGFIPISRLTFSIFISQFIFIFLDILTKRTFLEFRTYDVVMRSITACLVCTFIGYFVHLFYEAPSVNIFKLLMKRENSAMANKRRTEGNKKD